MKKKEQENSKAFLTEKKARDGKLSKIGEWLLSGKGKELGWTASQKNLIYIYSNEVLFRYQPIQSVLVLCKQYT